MVPLRPSVPRCRIARRASDGKNRDEFFAHALRIDIGRVGSSVFKRKPELRWTKEIALLAHPRSRARKLRLRESM